MFSRPRFRPRSGVALRLGLPLAIAAAFALNGCASTPGEASEPVATIIVHNDAPATVTIYAIRSGGARYRLGQIPGLGRAEFPIRSHMLGGDGRIQLLIDPLGSRRTYPTNSIGVREGDVLELRVSTFVR